MVLKIYSYTYILFLYSDTFPYSFFMFFFTLLSSKYQYQMKILVPFPQKFLYPLYSDNAFTLSTYIYIVDHHYYTWHTTCIHICHYSKNANLLIDCNITTVPEQHLDRIQHNDMGTY